MDRDPIETAELIAFVRIAELRSLSRAADELGLPRATVSRRLSRLEERLRVRLLHRTTRSIVPTDAGDALLHHARFVLDAVNQAVTSVRRTDDAIRGDLRVSVPPTMSDSFFAMVADFAARYPEVRMHVFFSSKPVDLRRDAWDVALRAGTHLEPGLIARTLARSRVVAVASPAYLARHGTPRRLADLRKHRCLAAYGRDELPQFQWPSRHGAQRIEGAFFTNDPYLLTEMARRGLGIAMLPLMFAGGLLANGELRQVLSGVLGADSQVAVVYAEREFVPPQVRAFVDALIAWGTPELAHPPRPRAQSPRQPAASPRRGPKASVGAATSQRRKRD
jgi:DNA-binding transcriptional LysR family regulator